jgi:hypothetical protein
MSPIPLFGVNPSAPTPLSWHSAVLLTNGIEPFAVDQCVLSCVGANRQGADPVANSQSDFTIESLVFGE